MCFLLTFVKEIVTYTIILKGYAHPVRYNALQTAGKIPADLAAKLPSADQYTKVQFVTDITELTNATNTLNSNWQSQVR